MKYKLTLDYGNVIYEFDGCGLSYIYKRMQEEADTRGKPVFLVSDERGTIDIALPKEDVCEDFGTNKFGKASASVQHIVGGR